MRKRTAKETKLLQEIEQIRNLAYRHMGSNHRTRVAALEIERDALIRTRVLLDCLMAEEAMCLIIMDYVLRDSPKWTRIKYFGRIKRYRIFYDAVLSHIPPYQKLMIVRDILKVPRKIEKMLRRLFGLRNIFAHTFTIDYTKADQVEYGGLSILNLDAFERYVDDANEAVRYLLGKVKW